MLHPMWRLLGIPVATVLLLTATFALTACGQCVPGPACAPSASNTLNASINSNTNVADKQAACRAAAFFETTSFGPGCTVSWQ